MSIYDIGTTRCRWREGLALIREAALDSSTPLGRELHEFDWAVSRAELNLLRVGVAVLSRGDEAALKKNNALLMPYETEKKTVRPQVDADEYAEATRSMLEQFGIDPSVAEADIEAAKKRF